MASKARTRSSTERDLFSALESETPPPPPVEFEAPLPRLAEIAVDGPMRGTFTYALKDNCPELQPGARVLVPFGPRNLIGFYLGSRTARDLKADKIDPSRLKPVTQVLDSGDGSALMTPNLLTLARWIARHYAAPLGATLSAMLPAGVKRGASGLRIRYAAAGKSNDEMLAEALTREAKKPKHAVLLRALANHKEPVPVSDLLIETNVSEAVLKTLEKAGFVRITERRQDDVLSEEPAEDESKDLDLNAEQQGALSPIEAALKTNAFAGFLLQGVTGSGKTEVYIRALKAALAMGRQGIILVPEIALTPQTARRFEQRLDRQRVAVLHSHVTDGDRAEAWRAIRAGTIDAVVGARSALFAPLPRLGLIVVDEEHETAFKQESTPRYHARDVATELARISNAVLVLGSATPSLESLNAARTTQLKPLVLSQRVAGRPMPPVEIVDLNEENVETKRYSYLSRRLLTAIDQVLHRREQAILFMNRRGFATVITCLRCGHTEKCLQCDITLTSHRELAQNDFGFRNEERNTPPPVPGHHHPHNEMLVCHYCGYMKPVADVCSACGAPGVKHWGLGTERVENEIRKAFPSARVARMDSDTMSKRTAYASALGDFRNGKTDILVGTQMIAKGLDFPNVTLVGVVLADTALHMPDFRSRERTFQLLAQVAGRAGRSDKGGRVIVQTHLPKDPAVRAAAMHDFDTFSLAELQERRAYHYPPFTRLARILIRGKDLKATTAAANSAADALRNELKKSHPSGTPPIMILGPAEAPIAKLEGYHRQHILLKAENSELLADLLSGPAGDVLAKLKGADAVVDVDPLSML
jgi:primosomal protein N' (replication factor Y)